MKNTFGNQISITLFGESHGPAIGAVLDGLAPGIPVDEDRIRELLSRRRPSGDISTARHESDPFMIQSGVFEGKTTGTPLCILIPNGDTRSADYAQMQRLARPSHADYTAHCKYHGYEDYRGGGHFSGRITAALVAAAGIVLPALERKGVRIATHIARCGGIADRSFADMDADMAALQGKSFPVLDDARGEQMQEAILAAKRNADSVGGVTETVVTGLPAGVGEPWFDTMESVLSHALFAVPAVKGVEFGAGFALAEMNGSTANDPFYGENGVVYTKTNHSGGINGGITNGMPITFRCAFRPTPTIGQEQQTIDLQSGENGVLTAHGRHDPCIVHRACVVVEAMTALTVADMLAVRFGTDWLGEI